jgi:hypothetical protein
MQTKMYEFLQALLIAEVSQPLRGEDRSGAAWRKTVEPELTEWGAEFDRGLGGEKVLGEEHDVLARVIAALRKRQDEYGGDYGLAVLAQEGETIGEPVVIFTEEPLKGRVKVKQEYLIGKSQGGIALSKSSGQQLWPVGFTPEWTGPLLMPAWIGLIARFDAIAEGMGDAPAKRAGEPIMQWLLREFAEAGKEWEALAEAGVEVPLVRREWIPLSLWGLSEGEVKL